MTSKKQQSLQTEFSKIYNLDLDDGYFLSSLTKAKTSSKSDYKKLKAPKVMSEETFIRHSTRIMLHEDLSKKTIKGFNTSNPPEEYKDTSRLFTVLPFEEISRLNKIFYNTDPKKRSRVWGELKLPIEEIEKYFIGATKEQNKFAKRNGFSSKISFMLNRYKIPKDEYRCFLNNSNEILNYCNKQLPKNLELPKWFLEWYNTPCYFCQAKNFPLKDLKQIISIMQKRYPILKKYWPKINIKLAESGPKATYLRETDSFLVTINKNSNTRHQYLNLIHELAHVTHMIKDFQKDILPSEKGAYLSEKDAYEIEMEILRSTSEDLYKAIFSDFLLQFRQTLFEIELYKNPNQNISRLYANTFNQCFKGAKQKENPLYLLEEDIVVKPLSTLPHAIAKASITRQLFNIH